MLGLAFPDTPLSWLAAEIWSAVMFLMCLLHARGRRDSNQRILELFAYVLAVALYENGGVIAGIYDYNKTRIMLFASVPISIMLFEASVLYCAMRLVEHLNVPIWSRPLLVGFFGYRVARRMRELAAAAAHIQSFDITGIEPLPGSMIREFDDASRAFNAAVSGLRWFETYLPKSLVLRLIRQDAGEGVRSDERRLTVLFTDIAGFTQLSERTPAAEPLSLTTNSRVRRVTPAASRAPTSRPTWRSR